MNKIFDASTNALKWCTWLNIGMLLFSLIGIVIDDRTLLGENVWLKPVKFGVSIPIYCITIALLLSIYPYGDTTKKWISRIIGWSLSLEIPLVMLQAARGVRSHFNTETSFDGAIFAAMGILIAINSLVLFFLIGTAFLKKLNTSLLMQRAIQFGWLGMIISMIAGQLMVSSLAHSVGVPDGGEGMPITHWSTEGGDWRVVHFLGMHGIQLLPLLAYFLGKSKFVTSGTIKHSVIWVIGLMYLVYIGYIFVKTQAGLPFLTI